MIQNKSDYNQKYKEESFSAEDKQLMRAHLRQRILVVALIAFLFYLVFLAALIMIENQMVDLLLTITSHAFFVIFFWKYLSKLVADNKKERKISYLLQVESKHVDTRYAWHRAMAWSSPRLKEFYFNANGRQYTVEEDLYQQLQPGDQVKISYAPASRLPLSKCKYEIPPDIAAALLLN